MYIIAQRDDSGYCLFNCLHLLHLLCAYMIQVNHIIDNTITLVMSAASSVIFCIYLYLVGWQVTLCDPIWQWRSVALGFHEELYTSFFLYAMFNMGTPLLCLFDSDVVYFKRCDACFGTTKKGKILHILSVTISCYCVAAEIFILLSYTDI